MSRVENIDRVVAELIDRGEADWVHIPEVWWVARSTGGASSDAEARELALEAISQATSGGLMEMGDVTEGHGFRAWPLPPDQVMDRIRREWPPDRPRLEMGEIGWLRNTPRADELAARHKLARGS